MIEPSRPVVATMRLAGIAALASCLAPIQAGLNHWAPRHADRLARRFHGWAGALLDVDLRVAGQPSVHRPTLFCANHVSYLDVVVLGSVLETSFVAKADVAAWPVIGGLARLQRTVFVERRRAVAAGQIAQIRAHLGRGENLVLFPEATSSEGRRVLPFKSSLFAAAEPGSGATPFVQPMWIAYRALDGRKLDAATQAAVAWYGEMTLLPHLFRLAGQRRLSVEVGFAPPVTIAAFASRKALAAHCHARIAEGLAAALSGPAWWEAERVGALLDSPGSGAIVVK
jgi:lyso-ornithine lipid O-acyltransferase